MTSRFEQARTQKPETYSVSKPSLLVEEENELNDKPEDMSSRMTSRSPDQRYDPTYGEGKKGKNFFSQFEDEDNNVPVVTNTPRGFTESMNEHFYNSMMQTFDWGISGTLGVEAMKQAAEYKNGPTAAARVMAQYKQESMDWENADWFYQEPNLGAQVGGLVGGLGGALTATAADPTTYIALPIKLFQYANIARPVVSHIADTAISYGMTNALYDVGTQKLKEALGQKEGYDLFQTMATGGLGALIGGPVGYFTRHNAKGVRNFFAQFEEADNAVEVKIEPPNPTNDKAPPPNPSPEADAPQVIEGTDTPKPERSPTPEKVLDLQESDQILAQTRNKFDYWKMPDEFFTVAGIDRQTYRTFSEHTQQNLAGLFSEYKDLSEIKRPPDILDTIRAMGGIKDDTGELKVLIGKSSTGRGSARPGIINNKTGMSPDKARELLVEQGYLKDEGGDGVTTSTIADLYDAIDENMRGTRRYSSQDLKQVEDFEAQEKLALEQDDQVQIASFAEYAIKEKYPDFALHDDEISDAARLYVSGVRDPDELLEQLAMLDLGPASKAVEIDDDIQFSMKPGGRPKRTQPELIEGGKITMKEYLQGRANGKLSPTKPQEGKESLGGLFGDSAKQTDLVDRMRQTAEDDMLTRNITKTITETAKVITRREFDVKPPTLPDMVAYATLMAKKDTSFMKGRFPQRYKQAEGLHHGGTGSIRLKSAEDLRTAVHEIAHSWEKDLELGPQIQQIRSRFLHEIGPLDYYPTRAMPEEGFAEFMRYYVQSPNVIIQAAPGFLAEFEAMLRTVRPKLLEQLKDLRAMYQAHLAIDHTPGMPTNVISKRGIGSGMGREVVDEVRRGGGLWAGVDLMARRVYTAMIDRHHPINKAVNNLIRIYNERAEAKGLPLMDLKASDDAYKLARLSVDAHQAAHVDLMHGTVMPGEVHNTGVSLNDAVTYAMGGSKARDWNGERMDRFEEYLIARRMLVEWDRHLKGELRNPPHSGHTPKKWMQRIEELNAEFPEFYRAAQMVYSFNRHQLLKEYNAGLLDDAQFAAMEAKSNYVPFYRDMTEFGMMADRAGGGGRSSKTGQYQLHWKFMGSDKDIHRPLENIMRQTYTRNTRIAQNEVFKKLADLSTRVGHGGASIMTRIPERELKRIGVVSPREAILSAAKEANIDPGDARAMADLVEEMLGPDAKGPIFRNMKTTERGDRIIWVWRNGQPEAYKMGDRAIAKEVYDALTRLGNDQATMFVRVFAGMSGALRAGVVTSPDFAFANFIRDQLSAWILSDVGFVPFYSGIKGVAKEVTGSEEARQYAQTGGMSGGSNVQAFERGGLESMEIAKLRKKGWAVTKFTDLQDFLNPRSGRFLSGKAAKDAVKGVTSIIEVSETGTRLGLYELNYKKARKEGLTEYEAMIEATFEARDYIDFGRYGSRMNAARKVLTFMNASLQGLDKSVRTLLFPYFKMLQGHPLTARERMEISRATKGLVKLTSLGVFGLTLEALYRNDPWYDEANEYYRKTHWIIPYGDGKLAVIPKPFELGLMSNLFQEGFQYFYKNDPLAWSRLAEGAYEAIIPPLDNPGWKTYKEIQHNYNEFTGAPIVPDYIEARRTPEHQYNEYTSNIALGIAKVMNTVEKTIGNPLQEGPISPMYVDHALTGMLGSWGRFVQNSSDGKGFSGDWTRDFITSRFLKEAWRGGSSVKRFWNAVNRTNGGWKQVAGQYKDAVEKKFGGLPEDLLEGQPDQVRAYSRLNAHFETDYKRMHPMRRAEDAAGVISKLKRELRTGSVNMIEGEDGEKLPLAPDQAETVLRIVEKLGLCEVRNGLIYAEAEGWAHRQPIETRDYWEQLREASPEAYEELRLRYEDKTILPEIGVRDNWKEAERRLLLDGEEADLDDLLSDAESGEDPGALE